MEISKHRRPYRWTGDPTCPTQSTSAIPQASGAPPPPPPGDDGDDNGEPWDNRPHPSRHYGGGSGGFGGGRGGLGSGGGDFPPYNRGNGHKDNIPPGFGGGFGGGGGPPSDPGDDGQYDNRETEDSENFPHYAYWPPYGIYYHAKPPHPKAQVNAADFYGMSYYHYHSEWPRPQEYHYTRQLPGGEDKWVWQEKNSKTQQDLNKESKLNLKLPSLFNGTEESGNSFLQNV